jgi:site-specific DNA-methyltransferase (adenine-specific)
VARKPLAEGTVAANVLEHGTGAINVDACRVGTKPLSYKSRGTVSLDARNAAHGTRPSEYSAREVLSSVNGRWPANVILSDDAEVAAAFEAFGERTSGFLSPRHEVKDSSGWNGGSRADRVKREFSANSGTAARFFYTAKAGDDSRLGSKHPTIKPLDLIQYLVRLITPSGGLVLDCFAGTGTTGEVAFREGMRAVLIEREPEYQQDIVKRMELVMAGPDEKRHAIIKRKGKVEVENVGPLFGWEAGE